MSPKKPNKGLLARVNFPLYTVQMLTSRHILVAGGGGAAKTGVANGFEVFELNYNGHEFFAEECLRHLTGGSSVMNSSALCTSTNTYLAAGQEGHCQLYTVNFKPLFSNNSSDSDKISENLGETDVRKRRRQNSQSKNVDNVQNKKLDDSNLLELSIEPLKSVQTDFSIRDPDQKVVRISYQGNFMATGGTDGHLRIWSFPDLSCLVNVPAHSKEINDLDFSIDEQYIASVAKDGLGIVWNVSTGKKVQGLQWSSPAGIKYFPKRCRFGLVEDSKKSNRLFVLTNPAGKGKAYLQQWDALQGNLTKSCPFSEHVSALAVRNDGRFVAVGTMTSGSVYIFIAFSLQKVLLVKEAHSIFVTGLDFLPVPNRSEKSPAISPVEVAVLSISVDNRICIHSLPFRKTFPLWTFILITVIILLFSLFLCDFLGL